MRDVSFESDFACAATSLAHLWDNQAKCTEARDLLAPFYCWFTEGLDTPVLQDAKATGIAMRIVMNDKRNP